MNKKFTGEEKKNIVTQYTNGQSAALLCIQHDIPRSTLYLWIKQHKKIKSSTPTTISYQEYSTLKKHVDMLEERLQVIKAAGCGTGAPLKKTTNIRKVTRTIQRPRSL